MQQTLSVTIKILLLYYLLPVHHLKPELNQIDDNTTLNNETIYLPCEKSNNFCKNNAKCYISKTLNETICRCIEGFYGMRCVFKNRKKDVSKLVYGVLILSGIFVVLIIIGLCMLYKRYWDRYEASLELKNNIQKEAWDIKNKDFHKKLQRYKSGEDYQKRFIEDINLQKVKKRLREKNKKSKPQDYGFYNKGFIADVVPINDELKEIKGKSIPINDRNIKKNSEIKRSLVEPANEDVIKSSNVGEFIYPEVEITIENPSDIEAEM